MGLQFAVVREDPALEVKLVEQLGARAALTVASGGCTALTLAHRFPTVTVAAFDLNPAQLQHLMEKAEAAARGDLKLLNVDDARRDGLNQRGAFEGLFRILRGAVEEFVVGAPEDSLERFFTGEQPAAERAAQLERWFASPFWSAAFQAAFAEPLLHAMFGRAATQHAVPGSYPGYFQAAFERGLRHPLGPHNPFLQHVWLGRYLGADAPEWTRARAVPAKLELHRGQLLDVPGLERFDLFSLSNIFDWSDDGLVRAWATELTKRARPGAAILLRQLNNRRPLRPFFEPHFRFDDALGGAFLLADRSLFYERIEVAFRT